MGTAVIGLRSVSLGGNYMFDFEDFVTFVGLLFLVGLVIFTGYYFITLANECGVDKVLIMGSNAAIYYALYGCP